MDLPFIKGLGAEIDHLCRRHRVKAVYVYGSTARGESRNASDVDLLLEMESAATLIDFFGFWVAIESLLSVKVDMITRGALSALLAPSILREAILIARG